MFKLYLRGGKGLLKKKWVGFLGGSVVKNPPVNAHAAGLIPGSGRPPGNGRPLQHAHLGNHIEWATVHGAAKGSSMA